ncbi:hypothetical protein FDUTEX481_01088 [Tolypothrix sp. PCC 7601]|nr:hypothetical protein FDUTEX481_01088 [Tolypothrix sp. PCC 7601]
MHQSWLRFFTDMISFKLLLQILQLNQRISTKNLMCKIEIN